MSGKWKAQFLRLACDGEMEITREEGIDLNEISACLFLRVHRFTGLVRSANGIDAGEKWSRETEREGRGSTKLQAILRWQSGASDLHELTRKVSGMASAKVYRKGQNEDGNRAD